MDVEVRPGARDVAFRLQGDGGASGLSVIPMRIRFGAAELSCGGIAGVGTDFMVRNRGIARRVITASLEWMHGERMALSWLFGISHFYEKFGFVSLLPGVTTTFTTADLATLPAAHVAAGAPETHRDLCLVLAAERDQGTFGGLVRGATWSWFRKGTRWGTPFCVRVAEQAYAVVD